MSPRAARVRRIRSTTESLLSIVLGLEAILVFFVTLVVFGLKALPAPVAFGGGGALIVVLLAGAAVVRWSAGVWSGWLLQAVLIATGVLVPLMYVIGAGFTAMYAWCFWRGRTIDNERAALAATDHKE
ncbi:DUF4233 domain-containing protein [Galbitalea sp. SE-J8]|uniref:DUF4233 domain-containing protein n=1 Tax=Galbitalea sp. SE-J8 TaxID=3054952 RepID=UPI00259CE155|nr:DUF4233 domain-containing protein [Galbitalea sp. SE-J8]MDM4761687.1 DUF4233 domain-containing protein [Galbitalea sp. SE-J8]